MSDSKTVKSKSKKKAVEVKKQPAKKLTVAFCGLTLQIYSGPKRFADELKRGFKALGYQISDVKQLTPKHDTPDICVVWNNLTPREAASVEVARKAGSKIMIMELGFIQRANHCQIDSEGFSHNASWRHNLKKKLDDSDLKYLDSELPARNQVKARDGYILVLGQISGDTQLYDSAIKTMQQLERLIARNVPSTKEIYFRPHPIAADTVHQGKALIQRMPIAENEDLFYKSNQRGNSLDKALEGAAFIITINSTAIIEATIAGVPCLALGPSIAIDAGAALQATPQSISGDIQKMVDGWEPEPYTVDNFLHGVLTNQHHIKTLSDPEKVAELIATL